MNLTEPIEIGKFLKNRKGDTVFVQIKSFEGVVFCDIRQFFQNDAGESYPTKKGVALALHKLPELIELLEKTLAKARELGLLREEQP